ncbi:hypothetical protein AGMMS49921_09540 [Endomicrobiia bacterium]|nr:hypothetical protein AGMMS49921_09540 [Endomicrobiia bacterium]
MFACTITASFECTNSKITKFLNSFSIPIEDTILIRRTFETSDKSRAFVNDSQISISALADIGELLVDFHGQDEKHSLLDLDSQLEILDNETLDIRSLLEKYRFYMLNCKI